MNYKDKRLKEFDEFTVGKAWEAEQQEWVLLHEPKVIKAFLSESIEQAYQEGLKQGEKYEKMSSDIRENKVQ